MILPSLLPHVLYFRTPCYYPVQPSKSSEERKNTSISKRNSTNIKYFPCISCIDPSFSTQSEKSRGLYRDGFLSGIMRIDQSVDPVVLAAWLRSCYTVKEVRKVHAIVLKCSWVASIFVDNNLMSVYLRLGKLREACKVFEKMRERNVVSWTAILNGYLRFGMEDEAFRLFSELIESGVKANHQTFVCLLNLCRKVYDFELGKQIHACIIKGNWGNLIVDSAIVHFYAQFGDLSAAFLAFNRMSERDVICWTTMITACAQKGLGKEAFFMFSEMCFNSFLPNEFTVCSILKACGVEKALKFGRQVHGAIAKKMFKDDVFLGTSLVSMYAKCGEISDSRAVFDRMKKRNTVTWTSMIAGYAQNGLGEKALGLFRAMKRRHIYVNNLTVVSILGACGAIQALPTGKEVHAQILKNSTQSNIYIGSTLVWFYCKCGDYFHASKVLQSMPFRDVVSWTAIISGCTDLGYELDALEFLKEMLWEGVEPNPFTYSSALKACAKLEAIVQGKLIHSSVNKSCGLSNVFVGSALINMYAKCGYVAEAIRVFDNMPEQNLVSWKAMIVGYARNGLCREALQLMYRMQAEGIKVDDHVLTTVLSACGDVEWDMDSSYQNCLQLT